MSNASFLSSKDREDEIAYALVHELQPSIAKTASVSDEKSVEAEVTNTIASVIETLVKCAEKLEAVGHASQEQVHNVLEFIEKEFLTRQDNGDSK